MFELTYGEVVLFLVIVWSAVRIAAGIKNRKTDLRREAKLLLVLVCIAVIVRIVYFPRRLVDGHIGTLQFDSSRLLPPWVNLIPLVRLSYKYKGWQMNIIGNITMFIPVGIIWPVCFKQLDSVWKTILAGAGLSLCIEISQLLFYARCSDVDDILLNTVGVAAGAVLYFGIRALAGRSGRAKKLTEAGKYTETGRNI